MAKSDSIVAIFKLHTAVTELQQPVPLALSSFRDETTSEKFAAAVKAGSTDLKVETHMIQPSRRIRTFDDFGDYSHWGLND